MRLGLVADLHGRLDPLLPRVLQGVDSILLAGDVVDEVLLPELARLAPLDAVRGNNDRSPGLLRLPEFLIIEAAGFRVLMTHDRNDPRLARELSRHDPEVLVVGHSHRPLVEQEGRRLVINPGSAGPKRFRLPRTAGTMTLVPGHPPLVELRDLERNADIYEGS